MDYPKSFTRLKSSFGLYQGIGDKTAERLSLYTIQKMSTEQVKEFAASLVAAKESIHPCPACGMLTDQEMCQVCRDEDRTSTLIVIESTNEAIAFEKTGTYDGRYFVLSGLISPLNGIGAQDINIPALESFIAAHKTREVILALSGSIPGEMTASYLKNILKAKGLKVYRIGHGLPAGAEIEYADETTLSQALEGKREL